MSDIVTFTYYVKNEAETKKGNYSCHFSAIPKVGELVRLKGSWYKVGLIFNSFDPGTYFKVIELHPVEHKQ